MAKIHLTDELRAQVLAGSTEIDLPEPIPAAGAPAASPAPAPAAASPAAAPAPVAAASPSADLVAHLNSQIAAKDQLILDANIKIRNLEAAAADSTGQLPALVKIAQASVGRMQVALGQADTSSAMDAKAVVEAHAKVEETYKAKFPVGGIAAGGNTGEPEGDKPKTEMHEAFKQRLAHINQQRA